MKNLWVLITFLAYASSKHEMYKGYKVYQIRPNPEQFPFIQSVLNDGIYDFWKLPLKEDGDRKGIVLVAPSQINEFESRMTVGEVSYNIQIDDVVAELNKEDEILARSKINAAKNGRLLSYDSYYRHDEINAYLDNLGIQYPNLVTIENGENSFEGREIKYVKISTSNFTDLAKPVIVMDALMHAREWITLPVATYIIDQLVNYSTDNADLIQNIDWIIVPIANPDGYEFTHDSARLWRKTRSTNHSGVDAGDDCIGVDGNRNFDYHWGEFENTLNPCLITYGGPTPFSEPETRNIRDILFEYLNRIELYVSVHSYGNMFLYPWAFDGAVPSNSLIIHLIGLRMASAIDQYALPDAARYVVGNSAHVLYYGTGISKDYAQLIGVNISYTLELPGYNYMFQVPPQYIGQVVSETWEGIKIGARDIAFLKMQKLNTS